MLDGIGEAYLTAIVLFALFFACLIGLGVALNLKRRKMAMVFGSFALIVAAVLFCYVNL